MTTLFVSKNPTNQQNQLNTLDLLCKTQLTIKDYYEKCFLIFHYNAPSFQTVFNSFPIKLSKKYTKGLPHLSFFPTKEKCEHVILTESPTMDDIT